MKNLLISPHGNHLVDRFVSMSDSSDLLNSFPCINVSSRTLNDIEMISTGVFSPIDSFLSMSDFDSVVLDGRLASGLPWTIPVVLPVEDSDVDKVKKSKKILIKFSGVVYASVEISDVYTPDKKRWVTNVYGTDDIAHPGVAYVYSLPNTFIGGLVSQYKKVDYLLFNEYRLTPKESRDFFISKGWSNITAFQTRNPIHRAHEYLLKCALEMSDAIFIHPLVGETKSDDIPADIRMECYKVLIDNYFPKNKTVLSVFPAAMNYAGPKEAIFHALCRKNYGCSHFIVGRDHAGVGSYYGTYDAHDIFNNYTKEEIGIVPLKFENSFYCSKCDTMSSEKTCPNMEDKSHHVTLSGTKVREMLSKGELPPSQFSRPEVARILIDGFAKK